MATAAAAIVARARRNVISHFMERNAVSSAAAVRWVPDRRLEQRILARFERRGVLVETAEDTFYLDVPAYDRWRRAMRRRTALMIGGVAAIGAILAAFA
jgi:CTP-dependent riboflavin kinase